MTQASHAPRKYAPSSKSAVCRIKVDMENSYAVSLLTQFRVSCRQCAVVSLQGLALSVFNAAT
jgi:hypothetical protein